MQWIVTANSNNCCIYEYEARELKLFKEINHPENKLANRDLVTDKQGHYHANITSRGAYSPRHEPKEIAVENFAREIARELNEARNHNFYEQLTLIMPDKMEGLVAKNLPTQVKTLIKSIQHKNVMKWSEKEIEAFLVRHRFN